MPRNAFYAQSGGVTAVINVSAAGVIETARRHPDAIGKVYAGRNGIIGALTEELIDTSVESDWTISALRYTPSAAFGSCRYKLADFDKHADAETSPYARLIEVFKAHDIGFFFYNGGGDSADTCLKISQLGEAMGYPIQAIHIPKTIDNDLPITDCSPGFGSAAKYLAVSIREAGYDVASMARTSTKVFILEVMGRHAGWLAAATGLAAEAEGDAPQVILFPEVKFDEAAFLAKVAASVKKLGYCAIVVSEGLRRADGEFALATDEKDAFGHARLGGLAPWLSSMIEKNLGVACHWAKADYLQRAGRHVASATDVAQAYAVGKAAVEMAMAGLSGVMPAIIRTNDSPYTWNIAAAPLTSVANVEKQMPREFISEDGFHITDACRRYLAPLIQGEDYPPYLNGLPSYMRLQNMCVPKRTGREFAI